MKLSLKYHSLLLFLFLLLLVGCRKNLFPLRISYSLEENGVLFTDQEDGSEAANLLYTASGGTLSAGGDGEGNGAVTVAQGTPVLWVPEEDPRDSNVQLTITVFDVQGRQLTVQTVSLNLSDGEWRVEENELGSMIS